MFMLKFILIGLFLVSPALNAKSQTAGTHNILITEIFPDPLPAVGLPSSEFIELRNMSSIGIDLLNWKIGDGSSTTRISISYLLKPDSMVIICPISAVQSWQPFGPTLGISSFPSLNNDADLVILYSPEGKIIHAVNYQSNWYKNDVKAEGGWTIEMIDIHNPCAGSLNWIASNDPRGGSPGVVNSVNGSNPDEQPPMLLRTSTIDSLSVIAIFDEPLDSSKCSCCFQIIN